MSIELGNFETAAQKRTVTIGELPIFVVPKMLWSLGKAIVEFLPTPDTHTPSHHASHESSSTTIPPRLQ
jgi:hypothetical protein